MKRGEMDIFFFRIFHAITLILAFQCFSIFYAFNFTNMQKKGTIWIQLPYFNNNEKSYFIDKDYCLCAFMRCHINYIMRKSLKLINYLVNWYKNKKLNRIFIECTRLKKTIKIVYNRGPNMNFWIKNYTTIIRLHS